MAAKHRRRRSKHIGFKRLSNKITREYRHKGFSKSRARHIGDATAGKVAREKKKK